MSKLGDVLSELVKPKHITKEDLGEEPSTAKGFGGLGAKSLVSGLFFVIY